MRPQIVCHMMSSIDGRLIGERWSPHFSGKTLDEATASYFDVSLELQAQAWMIGRKTVEIHYTQRQFEAGNAPPTARPQTFVGKRETGRSVVVFDAKGKILHQQDRLDGDNIIVVLSEQVSDAYLAHLRELGISYLFAGPDGHDLARAMETLGTEFGMTKVLLEGGGLINGMFLKAGLIDDFSLMIYPGIDGLAGMPSIIECLGEQGDRPAAGLTLELIDNRALSDGIVWLYYKVHRSA